MSLSGTWDCPRCGRRNRERDEKCLNCRTPAPRGGRSSGTQKLPVPPRPGTAERARSVPAGKPSRESEADPLAEAAPEAIWQDAAGDELDLHQDGDLIGDVIESGGDVEGEPEVLTATEVALEQAVREDEVTGEEWPLALERDVESRSG